MMEKGENVMLGREAYRGNWHSLWAHKTNISKLRILGGETARKTWCCSGKFWILVAVVIVMAWYGNAEGCNGGDYNFVQCKEEKRLMCRIYKNYAISWHAPHSNLFDKQANLICYTKNVNQNEHAECCIWVIVFERCSSIWCFSLIKYSWFLVLSFEVRKLPAFVPFSFLSSLNSCIHQDVLYGFYWLSAAVSISLCATATLLCCSFCLTHYSLFSVIKYSIMSLNFLHNVLGINLPHMSFDNLLYWNKY